MVTRQVRSAKEKVAGRSKKKCVLRSRRRDRLEWSIAERLLGGTHNRPYSAKMVEIAAEVSETRRCDQPGFRHLFIE